MSIVLQNDYPTKPDAAVEGQLITPIEHANLITVINREASAAIPFGRAVVWKTSSPTTDLDVLLPAAETDSVAGIVIRLDSYQPTHTITMEDGTTTTVGQLSSTGLIPGTMMTILRKGKIWVKSEDGAAVNDRLWVRAVAAGDPEFLGGITNADDGTDTIDCTKQGQFLSSGSAGALVQLEVNFLNKP